MSGGQQINRHTVMVDGAQTSISVEDAFWERLRLIATERGVSMNALVSEVARDALGSLSGALRVYALRYSGIAYSAPVVGHVDGPGQSN